MSLQRRGKSPVIYIYTYLRIRSHAYALLSKALPYNPAPRRGSPRCVFSENSMRIDSCVKTPSSPFPLVRQKRKAVPYTLQRNSIFTPLTFSFYLFVLTFTLECRLYVKRFDNFGENFREKFSSQLSDSKKNDLARVRFCAHADDMLSDVLVAPRHIFDEHVVIVVEFLENVLKFANSHLSILLFIPVH